MNLTIKQDRFAIISQQEEYPAAIEYSTTAFYSAAEFATSSSALPLLPSRAAVSPPPPSHSPA
ncbi:hypothetical protein, partial [Mesorhizobium sp. M7A.F.Ca.CA.004.12.1.1]|uniref:hypothetical protein n=1 Tax=Mesorhizobium sp. M7A.F.Ca.CA.004.12.1.1 TaxID=2496732 RepID=UPI0019D2FC7F